MAKTPGRARSLRGALALVTSLLLLAGSFAVLPRIGLAQDPTETDASVRFIHASPDAQAVDVIVDGAVVAEGLAFGQTSDYISLSPDEHQLQITPSGSGSESAIVDTTFDPEGGKAYEIAVSGRLNEIETQTYEVNQDDLEGGKSRVRVIHLSPDADNVDVFVTGGDELVDDLGFKDASDYNDLDAGTYDLEVRPHDEETVALAIPGFVVDAGRAYDIVVIGQSSDQSLAVVPLVTTVATPCSAVLGVGAGTDACVRVVHASPDAPAVDVYVNDSIVVENLAFGAATEFTALPAGDDRNFKVVPTGSPVDEAVADDDHDLAEGQAYQIVVADMLENIEALFNDVDLSPLPEGQSRIRLTHASPDLDDVDVVVTDGPTLFDGVGFKDVSDYEAIDAGTYDIQVKQGDEVVLRSTDLQIDAGMVYDLLATGRKDDGSLALLVLTAPAEVQTAIVGTPEVASTPVTVEEESPEAVGTPAG